ncbi:hypothetical protein B0T25DRAFT_554137 [Lasiosphaeria hispida]|uniref:Uncharacterized protein n=1 Tax=Lasiosphaeria hispida TaxID=260671 RepID=A0AAJ0HCX7_9PEZI|nr:hypothetical protein B0T25DRAFT_554137 [Lasiosphaeria hispida]
MLLKKGRLSKLTNDTEQNLVLAPGAFWGHLQLLATWPPTSFFFRESSTQTHHLQFLLPHESLNLRTYNFLHQLFFSSSRTYLPCRAVKGQTMDPTPEGGIRHRNT